MLAQRCKLAHAFLRECSYRRLKLVQPNFWANWPPFSLDVVQLAARAQSGVWVEVPRVRVRALQAAVGGGVMFTPPPVYFISDDPFKTNRGTV